MLSSHVPESVPFVENWVDSTKIEQQKVHVLEGGTARESISTGCFAVFGSAGFLAQRFQIWNKIGEANSGE